jgi:sugar phosphate isomerase/epimerase
MHNRRNFLKHTGMAAMGSLLFSGRTQAALASPFMHHKIGVQLFTFFNVIDNDVAGTLQQIAGIGYREIESAFSRKGGYYGMSPKAFSQLVKDKGMSWVSHHVLGAPFKMPPNAKLPVGADGKPITIPQLANLRDNSQQLVDEAAEGGVQYLVCANTPINTLDEIKQSIDTLNKAAELAHKAGLQFVYHNHDAEFGKVEGEVPYHLLLTQTDPQKVKMELDLAWAIKGGADPVELFNSHPGRFPLWHVKDLTADHKTILPVGEGTIDFKRIFNNAGKAGMQHFFVEHDMPADAFASIKTSFANLQKLA